MGRYLLLGITAILSAAVLVSGCSKSVSGPEDSPITENDKAEIVLAIDNDPLFSNDRYLLDDDGSVTFTSGGLGKSATPIYPRGWGRKITSLSREISFEKVDESTVVATITHSIGGEIKIAAKYSPQDTSITIVTKQFSQTTVRKVKFEKNIASRWVPREVSAVKGGTEGSQLTIDQLEVVIGGESFTITDPTAYFMKLPRFGGREVPQFGLQQPITIRLTLTSAEPDTDMVTLRRPWLMMGSSFFRAAHVRMRLVEQQTSGSTFVRVYEHSWTGHLPGRHHVFVDAVTRGSLFDDAAPFASQIWGVPYIVQ